MSLANKYRPKDFDSVVEQRHIIDILQSQIANGNNISNYVFFGPRGVGKTTTARIMAKGMNCLNPNKGNPCNVCENCKLIDENKTFDVVEIDAASHTGVDNVRQEIIEKAMYQPANLKKKVYIIDEVHMLSKGAFNALLKIMEEPPHYLVFILATTEIHKIPETILSRCQIFQFKKIHKDEMIERLGEIAEKEHIKFEPEALVLIAKLSEGGMRDGIKYLDQVSILGDITLEHCMSFLGVAGDSHIQQFIDAIKSKNIELIFNELQKIQESGVELDQFAKQLLQYVDEHLLEDPEFNFSLVNLFSEIIKGSKNFPNPLILYKTKLYEFCNVPVEKTQGERKKEEIAPKIETKHEHKIHEVKAEKHESVEKKVEEKSEKKIEGEGKVEAKIVEEKVVPKMEIDQNNPIQVLASRLSKQTVANTVKSSCSLESVENGIATISCINKMFLKTLEHEDAIKEMSDILTEVLGEKVDIKIIYRSKEEVFGALF